MSEIKYVSNILLLGRYIAKGGQNKKLYAYDVVV